MGSLFDTSIFDKAQRSGGSVTDHRQGGGTYTDPTGKTVNNNEIGPNGAWIVDQNGNLVPNNPVAAPRPGDPNTWAQEDAGQTDSRNRQGGGIVNLPQNGGYDWGGTPGNVRLPYYQQDRANIQDMLKNRSPFASQEWGGLISQLKDRANGVGPSLAQQNYSMANDNTVNALSSMARGSASPDAARQAMIQQGRLGQGQAAGLALAGTQEQQAAQSGLQDALGTQDKINSAAYSGLQGQLAGMNSEQLKAMMGNSGYFAADKAANNQSDAQKMESYAKLAAILASL